jgi:hypothetical protein
MTITNAKFLVKYTGSPTPTSDTAVAKSLKGAGPLTIGALHALNELLPDVVEDDGAGDYTITLQALDDLCTAELLFTPDVSKGGMHYVITLTRWTRLFSDLDIAGMSWAPISGDPTVAIPIAATRMQKAMRNLSTAACTIDQADVFYDKTWDDPETGTYYDWIQPGAFLKVTGGASMIAQFRAITIGCYSKATDGGRRDDQFGHRFDQMRSCLAETSTTSRRRAKLPPSSSGSSARGRRRASPSSSRTSPTRLASSSAGPRQPPPSASHRSLSTSGARYTRRPLARSGPRRSTTSSTTRSRWPTASSWAAPPAASRLSLLCRSRPSSSTSSPSP